MRDGTFKDIHSYEWYFVSDFHFCNHGIDSLKVQLAEIQTHLFQKLMACYFEIMLIIGVVYMTLRIALVITYL